MRILTTTIARVLFALPFALFGISHLFNGSAMAGYVPVPGGVFWVYFTGIAMICASIGILTKILGKWAALGLAALLVVYIVSIHIPHLAHPEMRQMTIIQLLKDIALCGASLTWAGLLGLAHEDHAHRASTPSRPADVHP